MNEQRESLVVVEAVLVCQPPGRTSFVRFEREPLRLTPNPRKWQAFETTLRFRPHCFGQIGDRQWRAIHHPRRGERFEGRHLVRQPAEQRDGVVARDAEIDSRRVADCRYLGARLIGESHDQMLRAYESALRKRPLPCRTHDLRGVKVSAKAGTVRPGVPTKSDGTQTDRLGPQRGSGGTGSLGAGDEQFNGTERASEPSEHKRILLERIGPLVIVVEHQTMIARLDGIRQRHICGSALPLARRIGHYERVGLGRRSLAGIVGLSALGCVACSSTSHQAIPIPSTYPASAPSACAVFRDKDAAEVLGEDPHGGVAGPLVGPTRMCSYTGRRGGVGVELTYVSADPRRANMIIRGALVGRGAHTVTHLGDSAVWTGSNIVAFRGRWEIEVEAFAMPVGSRFSQPDFAWSLAAARIAVSHVKAL